MKRGEISSGVLVELLKNKHQVAETEFTVGLTGRTANEGGVLCAIAMLQLLPNYQLREIDTPTLHATNCRFVLQSEDRDIDPQGRGITPSVHPQIASPEESSQLPRYAQLSGQRQPNLKLKFTDDTKGVGIFYHDGIGNMILGKPTAILVSVEQSYS